MNVDDIIVFVQIGHSGLNENIKINTEIEDMEVIIVTVLANWAWIIKPIPSTLYIVFFAWVCDSFFCGGHYKLYFFY